MSQYFKVGKIVNTQGLKGEVRVISTTDFAEDRYQKGVELALFRDGEFEKLLTVKSHRRHKNFDLLTFELGFLNSFFVLKPNTFLFNSYSLRSFCLKIWFPILSLGISRLIFSIVASQTNFKSSKPFS